MLIVRRGLQSYINMLLQHEMLNQSIVIRNGDQGKSNRDLILTTHQNQHR